MKFLSNAYILTRKFTRKVLADHVSAYAAQTSFFIMVCFIPFIILMLSLIQYTPITQQMLLTAIIEITPSQLDELITIAVNDIYLRPSTTLISISAFITLWVAGKIFLGITRGLNSIYNVSENKSYLLRRLFSSLYTFVFMIIMILFLLILLFSHNIFYATKDLFPLLFQIMSLLLMHKFVITQCLLTTFFMLLYKFVPSRQSSLIREFPGAFFSAAGWQLFTYVYSLYVKYSSFNAMYGNLATIVFAMLWLYFCMTIFFYGAEINTLIHGRNSHSIIKEL